MSDGALDFFQDQLVNEVFDKYLVKDVHDVKIHVGGMNLAVVVKVVAYTGPVIIMARVTEANIGALI